MPSAGVNTAQIERLVREHARDRMERLGRAFVDQARELAPRRSGDGADSIEAGDVQENSGGYSLTVTVGAEYMRFQNEGTGVYGPGGQPITARPGGVLAFDWPAAGGMVFAHHVRGVEATHWWDRTILAWPRIVSAA